MKFLLIIIITTSLLIAGSPDILIKEEAIPKNLQKTVYFLADSLDGRNSTQLDNLDSASRLDYLKMGYVVNALSNYLITK
ncbi:MAG: hypothetical protein PF574_05605 [Candidatus Delongbacteria bacterium]|jgi:hypothetical protein|nr:hypothetical protein [Candidatus Delongbacteria bacterium]